MCECQYYVRAWNSQWQSIQNLRRGYSSALSPGYAITQAAGGDGGDYRCLRLRHVTFRVLTLTVMRRTRCLRIKVRVDTPKVTHCGAWEWLYDFLWFSVTVAYIRGSQTADSPRFKEVVCSSRTINRKNEPRY